jgi:hypothetical protein
MDKNRPEKDILKKIRHLIETDNYIFTEHANGQAKKRKTTIVDVLHVLRNGRHEEEKTIFSIKHQCWHYAINGDTIERSNLRVIVAIEDGLVIITVIKLHRN